MKNEVSRRQKMIQFFRSRFMNESCVHHEMKNFKFDARQKRNQNRAQLIKINFVLRRLNENLLMSELLESFKIRVQINFVNFQNSKKSMKSYLSDLSRTINFYKMIYDVSIHFVCVLKII